MSKMARVQAESKRLSSSQIQELVNSLAKAVEANQGLEVMQQLQLMSEVKGTDYVKPFLSSGLSVVHSDPTFAGLLNATGYGSMTDAAKRQREDNYSEAASSEWSHVQATSPRTSKSVGVLKVNDCHGPSAGQGVEPGDAGEDVSIPLPNGISNISMWGRTKCTLPKVEKLGLTYEGLVTIAKTDREMASYVKWLKNRFGDKPTESVEKGQIPKSKMTQGQDFARYLARINWQHTDIKPDITFVRDLVPPSSTTKRA